MLNDFAHLDTLRLSLSREQSRLANATSKGEIAQRTVFVSQIEKEIASEVAFLARKGIVEIASEEMSDDELLAELAL